MNRASIRNTQKTKYISASKIRFGLCLVDEQESYPFWESCFDSVPTWRNPLSNTTEKTEAYKQQKIISDPSSLSAKHYKIVFMSVQLVSAAGDKTNG